MSVVIGDSDGEFVLIHALARERLLSCRLFVKSAQTDIFLPVGRRERVFVLVPYVPAAKCVLTEA